MGPATVDQRLSTLVFEAYPADCRTQISAFFGNSTSPLIAFENTLVALIYGIPARGGLTNSTSVKKVRRVVYLGLGS